MQLYIWLFLAFVLVYGGVGASLAVKNVTKEVGIVIF
jgi:hypothetical protein